MSSLVIYYSRSGENYVGGSITYLERGNTEIIVEEICKVTGSDVFRIETEKEYPADYTACTEEAKKELAKKARPRLKRYLESLEGYDTVFIAGPCWWGTFPMAVFSQLELLNWKGKKICIVMTHEGSGLGNSEKNLKKLCKGARFGKSLAVTGSKVPESGEQIRAWAAQQISGM